MEERKMYKLMGADGIIYLSSEKGQLGGNGRLKIYGQLDCGSALNAIKKYGDFYPQHRVFFKDEATAIAAGFRPCGNCMKAHYRLWKEGKIIPGDLEATKKLVDFL